MYTIDLPRSLFIDKKMKCFLVLFTLSIGLLQAQVEKIYDDKGMLQAINPLNKKGIFEGTGLRFYEDGSTQKEVPYKNGQVHGLQKEFYPDGSLKALASFRKGRQEGDYLLYFPDSSLKMRQEWRQGKRNGEMKVYYQGGELRIFALLRNDSILFAQRFDSLGLLKSEKVGYINQLLDTTDLPAPRFFLEVGNSLKSKLPARVQIVQSGIPLEFLSFTSPDGKIEMGNDEIFPLIITPSNPRPHMRVYVLIRTKKNAEPVLKRRILLPVD